jgi:hypothetical protein
MKASMCFLSCSTEVNEAPVTRQIQRIGSIKSHAILGGLHHHYAEHFSVHAMAKIDFTYECSDCGAEIRQTVTKPELLH